MSRLILKYEKIMKSVGDKAVDEVNPDPNLIFGSERWKKGRNTHYLAVMEGLFPEVFETQGITRGADSV